MGEEAVRKSARTSTAAEKRKPTDERGDDQLKKKLKRVEDKIEELAETSVALTNMVTALQKKANAHHGDDSNKDDTPTLSSAQKSSNAAPSSSRGTLHQSKLATPPAPIQPWPPAPLTPGVDPKAPKMANEAYDTVVAGMLMEAQEKFEYLLFVEDAYPDTNTQIRWSTACWGAVSLDHKRYFALSKEMMGLFRARCSRSRSTLLSQVRPAVDVLFNADARHASVKCKNATLANSLLKRNAFYYAEGLLGKKRFDNKLIQDALQRAFFGGANSCAAIDRARFNPIPLASIALVCTIIEHCVHEWDTGVHVPTDLDETVDVPRYRNHMANTVAWKDLNENATTHIREQIFTDLFPTLTPAVTTGAVSQETLDEEREWLEDLVDSQNVGYDTEEEV